MPRSPLPLIVTAVVIAAAVVLLYLNRSPERFQPTPPEATESAPSAEKPEPPSLLEGIENLPADQPADPLSALENAGVALGSSDPADLVGRIGEALETGDWEAVAKLLGADALPEPTRRQLIDLAANGGLKLAQPPREVGELELNRRARWALPLTGDRPPLFLDLAFENGRWKVERLALPGEADLADGPALADPLALADAFLQATLRQDFHLAKRFVDSSAVSDAKIAGLCILFEEGGYRLRERKPLRAIFQRADTAGFLAQVTAADGSEAAQFALTVRQDPAGAWQVREINLDALLDDYARRIAGGDVYYTPLVGNPQGGDTLVLYFEFDEAGLTPRTERQLGIVAELLALDPNKKLTLSGHTDALGTESYNEELSAQRARSVADFLIGEGVDPSQIVTLAKGQSQPRRPNFTESGEDNPEGRRANRRTEIYLDF